MASSSLSLPCKSLLSLLLLLLVSGCSGALSGSRHPLLTPTTTQWNRVSAAPSDELLTMTIVLENHNVELLENYFWAVSTPSDDAYTSYLSVEEVGALVSPPQEDIEMVMKWCADHGADAKMAAKYTNDFITVVVDVATAESMFETSFSKFSRHDQVLTRASAPASIPTELKHIISFVSELNQFPSDAHIEDMILSDAQKRQFGDIITPSTLVKTFSLEGVMGGKASGNSQAIASFLGQFISPSDLQLFQSKFDLEQRKVSAFYGPNEPSNPGVEAQLDIEYITGVGQGIPTFAWSTAGLHEGQEPFVQWAALLNNSPDIPMVHSVSYGDSYDSVDPIYSQRFDVELMKLGARGVTILFASGDNGVGCAKHHCVTVPNWPAQSLYVTAVGGFGSDGGQLSAATLSSGGFSDMNAAPAFQKEAIANYFSQDLKFPPASSYNATGRGIPDVSSFALKVEIVFNGQATLVGGTSCAAPAFAGVVALINDALIANGKKPVGFLNPALYSFPAEAFVDITEGSNGYGCCPGFPAAKGWDPVTGLGGPNYPALLAAFTKAQED
eukprot:TRINITY_DN2017_c0_g3_i1.p1 TRINITY_DN2017_c0_g3~~TRINITY_DN2017_c0_g3_i1.p1  ORF type:complete len:557 (-),score=158.23 TRINITY_DN2017_c0_g3_i1:103-1773(-)